MTLRVRVNNKIRVFPQWRCSAVGLVHLEILGKIEIN